MAAVSDPEDPLAPPAGAPAGIFGPDGRPRFFTDAAVDRFVASLLNLAAEVWIQEERLAALEAKEGGGAKDPEVALKAFIDRVFAPLRES
ncbi:MAG TPA: hypothetical protein VIC25_07530 [Caulobacteraceae bacterium]